jgi:hypothetical protein
MVADTEAHVLAGGPPARLDLTAQDNDAYL